MNNSEVQTVELTGYNILDLKRALNVWISTENLNPAALVDLKALRSKLDAACNSPNTAALSDYGESPVKAPLAGARQLNKAIASGAFELVKPPLNLILRFPHAMAGLAKVLAYGEAKHGGFKEGKASEDLQTQADSLLRHLTELLNGEETDPESGLSHRAHLLSNAVFLAEEVG